MSSFEYCATLIDRDLLCDGHVASIIPTIEASVDRAKGSTSLDSCPTTFELFAPLAVASSSSLPSLPSLQTATRGAHTAIKASGPRELFSFYQRSNLTGAICETSIGFIFNHKSSCLFLPRHHERRRPPPGRPVRRPPTSATASRPAAAATAAVA